MLISVAWQQSCWHQAAVLNDPHACRADTGKWFDAPTAQGAALVPAQISGKGLVFQVSGLQHNNHFLQGARIDDVCTRDLRLNQILLVFSWFNELQELVLSALDIESHRAEHETTIQPWQSLPAEINQSLGVISHDAPVATEPLQLASTTAGNGCAGLVTETACCLDAGLGASGPEAV